MMRVNIIEPIEISSLLDGINWIYKINIKLELISSNDKAARWGFRFHQSARPGPGGTSERHRECPAGSPLCRSSWWSSRHWRRGRGRPGPWRQALTERKYQSNNLLKPDNCFEGPGWIVNSVQSSQWKEMKYHSLLWRICISFQLLTVHRGLNQGGTGDINPDSCAHCATVPTQYRSQFLHLGSTKFQCQVCCCIE